MEIETVPEFEPEELELARRKLSEDKFQHSIRVARLASRQGSSYGTVGLLHDVFEDSDATEDDIRAAGVSESELAAIELLTRRTETYDEYIATLAGSGDRLAISVKLCDLLDHLDPAFNAGLTDEKVAKYLGALPAMIAALRELNRASLSLDDPR